MQTNDRHFSHHQECLNEKGYVLCSPASGSMRPMLRVLQDQALFVSPTGRLKPLDVAMYLRDDGVHIMHRVIKVLPEGGYYFRGDNAWEGEHVREDQILAVMQGFYRGEKYYSVSHCGYRLYRRLWVGVHPIFILYKKGRRKLCSLTYRLRT